MWPKKKSMELKRGGQRQTLPMKFHLPLWGLIQRVLGHQNSDGWSLEMPGEIHAFLETWAVKKFLSGLTVV